jgi:hypothetical protein
MAMIEATPMPLSAPSVVPSAHHVQVTLHDDALAALHARRRRFADNDVADLVSARIQPQTLPKSYHEINDFTLFLRRSRNCIEIGKVPPHGTGFQLPKFVAHGVWYPFCFRCPSRV